jgi:Trk-type K+ transport system membrane component
MNRDLYISALCIVFFSVGFSLLVDLILWLQGRPTITDFLRQNPSIWWYPVLILQSLIIVLSYHLFRREFPGQ